MLISERCILNIKALLLPVPRTAAVLGSQAGDTSARSAPGFPPLKARVSIAELGVLLLCGTTSLLDPSAQ